MSGMFYGSSRGARPSHPGSDALSKRAVGDVRIEVRELERQVEKAYLIIEALWTFVREKHGMSDEELVEKVTEIDLRDGKLDGKSGRTTTDCVTCGRKVGADRAVCVWCGARNDALF